MRKTILLIIIAVVILSSCSQSATIYKIGVAQCSKGPWREKVNKEMLAAQHLYEYDVKVTIANSIDDPELQARQIDSLAKTGIDLMVVAPYEDIQIINDLIPTVYTVSRKIAGASTTTAAASPSAM